MKINTFTLRMALVAAELFVVIPRAVVYGQEPPVEGRVSAMLGSYVIPGFGEVSTPELGNDYHLLSARIYKKPKGDARVACMMGGHLRTYSRYNTVVYSTAFAPELQLRTQESIRIRVAAGPLLQLRDKKLALGVAVTGGLEIDLCGKHQFIASGDFEFGRLGLYSDMEAGLRFWNRVELSSGKSFFRSGNFVKLNVRVMGSTEIGATYVWSRSMNEALEELGYGEYKRRGLGLQVEVKF